MLVTKLDFQGFGACTPLPYSQWQTAVVRAACYLLQSIQRGHAAAVLPAVCGDPL